MNPRSVVFLTLLLAAPLAVSAQPAPTLEGVVTTRDDGLSLPGATVAIESLRLSATTGPDGRYSLALPADAVGQSYEVKVTSAGLVPRTWTFRPEAGTTTQNFALSLTFLACVRIFAINRGSVGTLADGVNLCVGLWHVGLLC